jgi:hypothetical protein
MDPRSVITLLGGLVTFLAINAGVFGAMYIVRESSLSLRERRRLSMTLGLSAVAALLGLYGILIFSLDIPSWVSSGSIFWFLFPMSPAFYYLRQK